MRTRYLALTLALSSLFLGTLSVPTAFNGSTTTAQAAGATYGQLISSLKNIHSELAQFRSMMGNLTESQIQFVNVSDVIGGNSKAEYEGLLKKNESAIAGLRTTIANTSMTDDTGVITGMPKVLKDKNLTTDRFVAVDVSGNNVVLFYQ